MPKKIQDFAMSALVQPLVVNVGRAGAANLDVIQEVEYVKQEAKIVYLLECLQKTPPPVCALIADLPKKKNSSSTHVSSSPENFKIGSFRFLFLLRTKTMWMIFMNTCYWKELKPWPFMEVKVSSLWSTCTCYI